MSKQMVVHNYINPADEADVTPKTSHTDILKG